MRKKSGAKSSIEPALRADALAIRRRLLRMHFEAQASHLGSSLSSVDILAFLWRDELRCGLGPGDDEFILSKGHAASGVYATLAHFGLLSEEELATYYRNGTQLAAHPTPHALTAMRVATGSLGHGLPIAAGLALAKRRAATKAPGRVVCLLSDGECNEGAVWEAAAFAAHHRLGNLVVIVDANGWQGFGRTEEVLRMEPLVDKWQAFGFATVEADGHDFASLRRAFRPRQGRPLCLVARTIKGRGISFMENCLEWHYLAPKPEEYERALRELDQKARRR